MSVKIFLSTVSDEFRAYRDYLRSDLTRHNVEVKVQEDFKDLGRGTLDMLDTYIAHCDAVVHLVGDMIGAVPHERDVKALVAKHSDLTGKLPPLGEALQNGEGVSYTQWEAWLALYHGKCLLIAKAAGMAERGPKYAPTAGSHAAQAAHMERLAAIERFAGCPPFTSADNLAKYVLSGPVLDLLVQAYAEKEAQAREVAEGFIHEMAKRVSGDRNLDFEGMKREVRNAIDIYAKEIAGGPIQTNVNAIVDKALAQARSFVDAGKSSLGRATLRHAAEAMRREEEERRQQYVNGITVLYNRQRDIALAAYEGEAAAESIILLAEAIHGANTAMVAQALNAEATALYEYGRDRGSNVHLVALIELRRKLLDTAASIDERGIAHFDLGLALRTLGERESGTAKLEEAVSVYRTVLKAMPRDRAPLVWAQTQVNLGNALQALGERESGTALLEEAVRAYRAALEEWTRDGVPLQWATTQTNLGNALARLGERQTGTARLQQAITAYRDALKVLKRQSDPPQWARTQMNLGNALTKLAERENGTARLKEAILAFKSALEEWVRDRAPLDWAMTQHSLGLALMRVGEREKRTPLLEQAEAAFRAALEERRRDRVPLQWAMTQNGLGGALAKLGELENRADKLEEAVAVFQAALEEWTTEAAPYWHEAVQHNLERINALLAQRRAT